MTFIVYAHCKNFKYKKYVKKYTPNISSPKYIIVNNLEVTFQSYIFMEIHMHILMKFQH